MAGAPYDRRMAKTGWSEDAAPLLRVGDGFELSAVDTTGAPGFSGGKADGARVLQERSAELGALQERLFASSRAGDTRSVLLVLQAMDTAGKGGIVTHALAGTDPQGLKVHAFKAPTPAERRHDFLWRIRRQLPSAGLIGVFDRSHYEDVIVHRVKGLSAPDVIESRYGIIRDFEEELADAGTTVVKVMLHISAEEQKKRLLARLDQPDKHWKYNPGDIDDRLLWPQFQEAYQVALERTAADRAPWYVIPADRKWYARIAVQSLLIDALTALDPQWPAADFDVKEEKRRVAAT